MDGVQPNFWGLLALINRQIVSAKTWGSLHLGLSNKMANRDCLNQAFI